MGSKVNIFLFRVQFNSEDVIVPSMLLFQRIRLCSLTICLLFVEVLSSLYRCLLQPQARNKCINATVYCFTECACITYERLRKHSRFGSSCFVLFSVVYAIQQRL